MARDSWIVPPLFTLLADDQDAQRLVVAWPRVPAGLRDDEMRRQWSALSGVSTLRVKALQVMLEGNGVIWEADGVRVVATAARSLATRLSPRFRPRA